MFHTMKHKHYFLEGKFFFSLNTLFFSQNTFIQENFHNHVLMITTFPHEDWGTFSTPKSLSIKCWSTLFTSYVIANKHLLPLLLCWAWKILFLCESKTRVTFRSTRLCWLHVNRQKLRQEVTLFGKLLAAGMFVNIWRLRPMIHLLARWKSNSLRWTALQWLIKIVVQKFPIYCSFFVFEPFNDGFGQFSAWITLYL